MHQAFRIVVLIVGALTLTSSAASAGVGPTRWSVAWSATMPFYGSVMVGDEAGTVVVGYDGEIVALDPDGGERWNVHEDVEEVVNRPVFVGELVVVAARHSLVAVDRSTGAHRWGTPVESARLAAGERAGEPVVLATSPDGRLRVLDAGTGALVAERAFPAPAPDGAPIVFGSGELAVAAWGSPGRCCTIAAFHTADGSIAWQRRITDRSTEPLVRDGVLYVAMNGVEPARGRVLALDAATGEPRWRTAVRGVFRPTLASAAAEDLVVVTTGAGAAIALDAESGARRWRSEPTVPAAKTHPKIGSEHVFLTPHSTNMFAFDRASGELVSGGPIDQTIVVTDSEVVDGHFQLLVTNGFEGQVWSLAPDGLRPGRSPLH